VNYNNEACSGQSMWRGRFEIKAGTEVHEYENSRIWPES